MYFIYCYVPESHLELVKQALFDAGAGQLGNYNQCCWQTEGTGQFCPDQQAEPFIGNSGELTTMTEYKIELACHADYIDAARDALLRAHPYETPAYSIHPINT